MAWCVHAVHDWPQEDWLAVRGDRRSDGAAWLTPPNGVDWGVYRQRGAGGGERETVPPAAYRAPRQLAA